MLTAAFARPQAAGDRRRASAAVGVVVFALMATASGRSSAANLGSLTTSVGVFGALAALLLIKSWSGLWGAGLLPTSSVLLLLVGGAAALLWRTHRRYGTAMVPMAAFSAVGMAWRRACNWQRLRPMPVLAPPPAPLLASPVPHDALPAGWNHADLMRTARRHFVQLQAAWDVADVGRLGCLTTPQMLDDLLAERTGHGAPASRTRVVSLHAELLGFEELGSAYLLSVEFSGTIRESNRRGDMPFRELWMLARPKDAGGEWKLARQQALL